MSGCWPAPGKLNLFLYVTGRRDDNYHFLQTFFHFINYGDTIEIAVTNNGKIRLFTKTSSLLHSNNLVMKAARLLQKYCWSNIKNSLFLGADIILNKVLPIGAGLGGGSSDAATVLVVLNRKWRCCLSQKILMKLGEMLGADVPVFILGYSSIAEGIGNILTPVFFMPEKWYLILIPPVMVSTSWVFQMYKLRKYCYSPHRSVRELLSCSFYNDFENIVRSYFPVINIYFKYLSQYTTARLTGTGSCIFSEFDTKQLANLVQSYLPTWMSSIVTRGANISPLYQKLLYT
ncbi:4-(cytidine 5'-diphospho)-2-C-methyl-D-erythritol kinase [Candidatus Blochmannia ocreatus (nom. nud.)]|uniref:4-diphosphocytidyl-2-C-methyl-D-erythritol kinase n=1 Tax=Candidatus Blochmannia ocreatus (nom. nud.) TaxID=251538 RepID=A0ABY4SS91_9ENTR|nr:4-(cytidine 5'-diphospho)-2-C-methyl-D-erythritol kinase [Candidatus Blochmannia ocreatus]URJ24857.1 4-(cytidine 5'-diphospho)-2-C-methyl-D-erythritol kinase [Candidatus Blochmannia ocreatus]